MYSNSPLHDFMPTRNHHKKRSMILAEVLWSLISLLVRYYQVLRKAIVSMAIQFSNSPPPPPTSPSLKRLPESPSFALKRLKETQKEFWMVEFCAPSSSMESNGKKESASSRKERKRPARIEILKPRVSLELCEAWKKEEMSDEGFEVEGRGYWLACRKGTRRHTMEDGYGVMTNINGDSKQAFFGVFDGHGGRAAVDFVREKLGKNVVAALAERQNEAESPEMAIKAAYLATDTEFLSQGVRSGACVASVLLRGGEIITANVGDCRVVLSKKGTANALTSDHRAEREDERVRIENSGGFVSCRNGVWRVQDTLAVSRAIGDESLKKWIISEPEITRLKIAPDFEFLIIASDGLWDKVGNQEAVDAVLRHERSMESCKVLLDLANSRGSSDDITVMVVDLRSFSVGTD